MLSAQNSKLVKSLGEGCFLQSVSILFPLCVLAGLERHSLGIYVLQTFYRGIWSIRLHKGKKAVEGRKKNLWFVVHDVEEKGSPTDLCFPGMYRHLMLK